jgi:hypothetical protein
MKTTVWCTTEFVGFHCWPGAPSDVKYLRDVHRHVFKVRVEVFVQHSNRDVEFQSLKRNVDAFLKDGVAASMKLESARSWSCEMIAAQVAEYVTQNNIIVKEVSVSEDGECGATVSF